jgi:xanthine phosphoribosyltransferase
VSAGVRIFRSLAEAAGHFGPCALTIGNFDGVHAGHRRILRRVVAVARGGLVPAAVVARELDIRMVETVSVIGYSPDDSNPAQQATTEVLKKPGEFIGSGEGWLIVDDLVDTGRTAEALRRLLPKAHFATIYAKPKGMPQVDTFVTEVSQDTWIYFPWDIELQFTQPIAVQRKGSGKK